MPEPANSRTQGTSKTLHVAEIERLVKLAYPEAPEEFKNHLCVNSFIEGVQDNDKQ